MDRIEIQGWFSTFPYTIAGEAASRAAEEILKAWATIDTAPPECYYPADYKEAMKSIAALYGCIVEW